MALAFRKASVALPARTGSVARVPAPRPVRASRVVMKAEPQVRAICECVPCP